MNILVLTVSYQQVLYITVLFLSSSHAAYLLQQVNRRDKTLGKLLCVIYMVQGDQFKLHFKLNTEVVYQI